MSRIDNLGEILDDYEGREHKEETKLTEEEVVRALLTITDKIGMSLQRPSFLNYEAKEAIAKAYYACLSTHEGDRIWRDAQINSFYQDLVTCLTNTPEKVKDFAEDYAKNLEENA